MTRDKRRGCVGGGQTGVLYFVLGEKIDFVRGEVCCVVNFVLFLNVLNPFLWNASAHVLDGRLTCR